MKHWLYYILFLLSAVVFVSCADEDNSDQYDDEPLQISVNAGWQCGRSISTSRAFVDPVTDLGKNIESDSILYPDWLHITLIDGPSTTVLSFSLPDEYLVKKTISENDNYKTQKYIAYHDVYKLSAYPSGQKERKPFYSKSQIQKLKVEANTLSGRYDDGIPQAWDDQDVETFGTIDHLTTKDIFGGSYNINRNHLFLDLGHATALLRLHFKVAENYDKIRKIVLRSVKITKIKIGDKTLSPAYEFELNASQPIDTSIDDPATTVNESLGFLLTTSKQLYAYGYMKPSHDYNGDPLSWANDNPAAISKGTPLTLECTYDIYENDIVEGLPDPSDANYETALAAALAQNLSAHCTRRSVTATNTTTLNMVFNSSAVEIKAGHYYDLMITINPDYLYVLSEHDNKHLTIQ